MKRGKQDGRACLTITNGTPAIVSCLTCTISTDFLSLSKMMLNLLEIYLAPLDVEEDGPNDAVSADSSEEPEEDEKEER